MMKKSIFLFFAVTLLVLIACNAGKKTGVPVVGFVDYLQDATLSKARTGFTDALKRNGFSEDQKNVKITYRNAQGSLPTLAQIVDYFIAEKVDLLATCTTLSTISALQKTKTIPVFQMVAPTAALMKVADAHEKSPINRFGVEEDLNYIDTSFAIIPKLIKTRSGNLTVGMIYNQAEPQSVDAMARIKNLSDKLHINLIATPVNTSADARMVTESLLSKNLDAFFANPDNTVFASFETILKSCEQKHVPIFTSEAGLVERGAVAAFGADIYQWGYQAGEQAAVFLKSHSTADLKPEMVKVRKRVYNPVAAEHYHVHVPDDFIAVK